MKCGSSPSAAPCSPPSRNAYATVFSGFYIAFMLLLLALILRAVSMEFRSKRTSVWWRRFWDLCFLLGSTVAPLLYGVAIGNMLRGIPLQENQDYAGTFFDLLNPYSLGVGIMALSLFVMHGNIYLYLKTEGDLQKKLHGWIWRHFFLFLAIYLVMTVWTMIEVPHALQQFQAVPRGLGDRRAERAGDRQHPPSDLPQPTSLRVRFLGMHDRRARVPGRMALFPNLVTSSIEPATRSITIYQDASSMKTLQIMLVIAVLGMPCVLPIPSRSIGCSAAK